VTLRSSGNISNLDTSEDTSQRILSLLPRSLTQKKEQVLPCQRSLRKEKNKLDMDTKFLKELMLLREDSSKLDGDTYFLHSLLPLMKISPEANMMFLTETQQNWMQKLYLVAPSAVHSPNSSENCDKSHSVMSSQNFQ
jgi:hypothetical protein